MWGFAHYRNREIFNFQCLMYFTQHYGDAFLSSPAPSKVRSDVFGKEAPRHASDPTRDLPVECNATSNSHCTYFHLGSNFSDSEGKIQMKNMVVSQDKSTYKHGDSLHALSIVRVVFCSS